MADASTLDPMQDAAIADDLSDLQAAHGPTLVTKGVKAPRSDKALIPVPVGMDWPLFAVILALLTTGVIMAYSASVYAALRLTHTDDQLFLNKHLVHAGIALLMVLVGAHIPYQAWRKVAYLGLFTSVALLVATLAFGVVVNKARRWLPLPGFMFQPSELAKLCFAVYLAHSLTKKISSERVHKFSVGFLPHALAWLVVFGLCMKQPDLGTGIVLAVLLFTMTYIAGTNMAYVVFAGVFGVVPLVTYILKNTMRIKRVLAILDPFNNIDTTGFQLGNSKIAVATGGIFGNGLGLSRQKLGFVPECHTDFILSIIAEELGLLGVALVGLAFVFLILRGLRIALRARDEFGRLLAAGITVLLGTQAAVNFGVVMGTLPTKGLTLPFVSHGGSSMIVLGLAAGILLNVGRGGNPDFAWPELPAFLQRRQTGAPRNQRSGSQRAVATERTGRGEP
ncbi:MAG: putative lipid II flippase FtsW [Deltaproteobacteria bacterium]|nr:putative lipid II flippase FtsW [Deltaproteobacteria bacterium]